MATAQETIVTGLQALRVLGMGQSPSTAQSQYCLRQLNAYIKQLAGFSGSLAFVNKRLDKAYDVTLQWPALRLQCVAGVTITLPEGAGRSVPDGFRLDVVDAAGTAATSPITIARNGWKVNGSAANYSISTNGGQASLFFRADLGDWKLAADLALDDDLPFPEDFDEAIALNAARRYTLFGQSLSNSDDKLADLGAKRIRARYKKPPPAVFDTAVSQVGGDRCGDGVSITDFLNGNA